MILTLHLLPSGAYLLERKCATTGLLLGVATSLTLEEAAQLFGGGN